MKQLKPLILLIAAVGFALTTNAAASTLTVIPLHGAYSDNQARAITPDGRFVVGFHGAFNSFSGDGGFLYDVAGATLHGPIVTPDGAQGAAFMGVGYRTLAGQTEIVLTGYSQGAHANFMTTDGGLTWGLKRRDTTLGTQPLSLPAANAMAGTTTDVFYSAFRDNINYLRVGQSSGDWPMTPLWDAKSVPAAESAVINGISGTGRGVGKRGSRNYVMDWNGGGTAGVVWFPTGLQNNETGQVFSVSADGCVLFGQSPVTDSEVRPGNWGYKAVYSGQTLQSIAELPYFPDTAGSSSLLVPYGCSADGRYACGMNYRGSERAVLWDTGDPDPANWTVTDLTEFADAAGILGDFFFLRRAYSVGVNGNGNPVVTGVGSYFDGVALYTRAFVMVIGATPAPRPLITSVEGAGTGSVTVHWTNVVTTTNYVLQYTTNLTSPNWSNLPPVTAEGATAWQTDQPPAGEGQRYYRVLVQ